MVPRKSNNSALINNHFDQAYRQQQQHRQHNQNNTQGTPDRAPDKTKQNCVK